MSAGRVLIRWPGRLPRVTRRKRPAASIRGAIREVRLFLSQHEQERLLIHVAADVARRRRERGLRLNHPEATAIITAFLLEGERDGRTVADLMDAGRRVLTRDDVLEAVLERLTAARVAASFPDGTKLLTVHRPIGSSQSSRSPSRAKWRSTPGGGGWR